MDLKKLISRQVTIRLTEDGFVETTRYAWFFSISNRWHGLQATATAAIGGLSTAEHADEEHRGSD